MPIPFVKIQGTGNDFVLIDNRNGLLDRVDLSLFVPRICDRKYGVGSDGLIALEEESPGGLVMIYWNPDGSDAGMCGNGARCFALFAERLGYGREITFRVHDRTYRAETGSREISVRFPLETEVKPVLVDGEQLFDVYTNTEHIICPVRPEKLADQALLTEKGRYLRHHEAFAPKGTNVNFISGSESEEVGLQTYERGVEALTLACGTGAIATAIAWHSLGKGGAGDFRYRVKTRGGTLTVRFTCREDTGRYSDVVLSGPAEFVFEGTFYLPEAGANGTEHP